MNKNKQTYTDLLKDPRWQKKRLEIMQRDNFSCQICGHKDKTLHVHHIHYEKDKKPWEHDESLLITLCEDCHREEHNSRNKILERIDDLQKQGVLMIEIEGIIDNVELSLGPWNNSNVVLDMLGGPIQSDTSDKQDFWGLDCVNDVCERISEWRKRISKR